MNEVKICKIEVVKAGLLKASQFKIGRICYMEGQGQYYWRAFSQTGKEVFRSSRVYKNKGCVMKQALDVADIYKCRIVDLNK